MKTSSRLRKTLPIVSRKSFNRMVWTWIWPWLVPLGFAPGLQAQIDESVDSVTLKENQVYCLRGDQLEVFSDVINLPFQVEVRSNGTFTVAGGAQRQLQEGQIIRKDGWLLHPNGALQPIFDHVTMLDGTVRLIRDGNAEELAQATTFSNGLSIAPDGSVVYPSGARSRLADGQLFRADGTTVPAKDTATLLNGQVGILKSGRLIPLTPPPMWGMMKIMGMHDGTKVRCDGLVARPDGTTFWLTQGQSVLIDGPAARR